MNDARLNSVAEALAHVDAPREAVEWARALGHDFPEAWRTCPSACWLVHLAHTARMPFESILAALTAASQAFLIEDFTELVGPLCELARSDAFKREERDNLGYGDGFVEQAYCTAAHMLRDLEAHVARERVLAIVREHTSLEEFLAAYTRCVKSGYAGLELVR